MKVIYEYRCDSGHVTEEMFVMGEAPSAIACHPLHPEYPPEWCQEYAPAKRQLSRGNFLTATGFHKQEYR